MTTAVASASVHDTDEALVLGKVERLLSVHDPKVTPSREFLGEQFDAGLAWVNFPPGCGGLGLSPKLQRTINERLAAARVPSPSAGNPIGYGMGAPTVVTHGSE